MLKNYPTTHLFLLSLVTLLSLSLITLLAGQWHVYIALVLDVLNFIVKVVCVFLLLGTIIEVSNDLFTTKKHLH